MGPTRGPSGADRTQVGPMLAPWMLLSGIICLYTRGAVFQWWTSNRNANSTNLCSQISKALRSPPIRHQSITFVSDRCLTEVFPKSFAVWVYSVCRWGKFLNSSPNPLGSLPSRSRLSTAVANRNGPLVMRNELAADLTSSYFRVGFFFQSGNFRVLILFFLLIIEMISSLPILRNACSRSAFVTLGWRSRHFESEACAYTVALLFSDWLTTSSISDSNRPRLRLGLKGNFR